MDVQEAMEQITELCIVHPDEDASLRRILTRLADDAEIRGRQLEFEEERDLS